MCSEKLAAKVGVILEMPEAKSKCKHEANGV
jgi:hypothetical protein